MWILAYARYVRPERMRLIIFFSGVIWRNRFSSKSKSLLEGTFIVAWWNIWRIRNRIILREFFPDVPKLVESKGNEVRLSLLLVDFSNAFNLVDMSVLLEESRTINQLCELTFHAWYLDDDTIVGDTLMVAKALDIIKTKGSAHGLFLNVDKTKIFWPVEDLRSRVEGVFPINISRPLNGVKLLGGSVSLDEGFCQDLALKRVSKTISLMEAVHKLHDPQCGLLLLHNYAGFDQALRDSLEKVVTASGPGFGDWRWWFATLPIKLGGLGILSAGDIIQYVFLASCLKTNDLHAKILMKTGIDSHGYSFQRALDVFNTTCNVDVLSITTYTSAPQMVKTLAKCYFCVIEKDLVSKYSLSPRHVGILSCIRAPHAQDFLFTIPIDGLGQRMNHRQFRSVLCYRLSVPMFSEGSLCPSCNAHQMDQYGDHAVHCCNEVGVKFRHNLVRDILVDICSKVGIMLQDKDACLDVTGISPFAGTGANSWAHGVALHNVVEKKKWKYASICEDNGYKFIPFAFSTFEEFDTKALDTLSRIKAISISHSK
nr:hypothetical protein [Tanacetum cinerariifolium]